MELKQVIKDIKELEAFNEKGEGEIGFNDQEREAEKFGYFEKLPNYLPAKLSLLKKREKETDENKKILLNAARIYAYTLFENTWFGYLIAYANKSEITFELDGKKSEPKSYNNHLPSFSSAILHFGTCRDLFFPLLKTLIYIYNDGKISDLMKGFKERSFYKNLQSNRSYYKNLQDEYNNKYNQEVSDSTILDKYSISKQDLSEYFQYKQYFSYFLCKKKNSNIQILNSDMQTLQRLMSKLYSFYIKIKEMDIKIENNDPSHGFIDEIDSLLLNSNIPKEEYLEEAEKFYKLNQFRNIFAHQLRMLWWKNRELWGFDSKHYDNIKLGNRDELWPVIEGIFKDHKKYEEGIERLDESEFTSAAKVLQDTHDTIATFLNSTFALIDQLLLSTEIQRTNSTV